MSRAGRGGFEASVGVFVLGAAAFLAVMVFMSGNFRAVMGESTEIRIGFRDVGGLKPSAPVFVAGTQMGLVDDITFHEPKTTNGTDTYYVTLTIKLPSSVVLSRGTRAFISSQGFLGEMFVGIEPGYLPGNLKSGEFLRGREMVSFADVQQTADETLRTVNDVVGSFKGFSDLASDRSIRDDLRSTISNARQITEEIRQAVAENRVIVNETVRRFDRIAASTETNVITTTSNLREFSSDLREATEQMRGNIDRLTSRLQYITDAGGDTLLQTAENIRVATVSAREGVTEIRRDLAATASEARRITEERETDVILVMTNLRQASEEMKETARLARELVAGVDSGVGLAGALFKDEAVARDFRAVMENSAAATKKLEELIEQIKKDPGKFFQFSLF